MAAIKKKIFKRNSAPKKATASYSVEKQPVHSNSTQQTKPDLYASADHGSTSTLLSDQELSDQVKQLASLQTEDDAFLGKSKNTHFPFFLISILILISGIVVGASAIYHSVSLSQPTPTPTILPTPTSAPTPSPVELKTELKIKVLNGTSTNGLAGKMKTFLSSKGLQDITTGNSEPASDKSNKIFYSKDKIQAELLSKLLLTYPLQTIIEEDDTGEYNLILDIQSEK